MGEVVGWDSGKRKYERLRILDIEKGVVTGWTEELRAAKADPR
jgi:hypothetical protein